MDIAVILIGAIMAGCGLLVKRYPHMISGYAGLPREKKKNIDLDGLTRHYSTGLYLVGAITVVVYFIVKLAGFPLGAQLVFLPVVMVGMIAILAGAFKYDHNPRRTGAWTGLGIAVGTTVFVCLMLVNLYKPHRIIEEGDALRITGKYGLTVEKAQVVSAELTDRLPRVGIRTNGSAVAGVCKGYFRVDEWGKTRLFTHPAYHGPYLIIKTDRETIAVQTPDGQTARGYLTFLGGQHEDNQR